MKSVDTREINSVAIPKAILLKLFVYSKKIKHEAMLGVRGSFLFCNVSLRALEFFLFIIIIVLCVLPNRMKFALKKGAKIRKK